MDYGVCVLINPLFLPVRH